MHSPRVERRCRRARCGNCQTEQAGAIQQHSTRALPNNRSDPAPGPVVFGVSLQAASVTTFRRECIGVRSRKLVRYPGKPGGQQFPIRWARQVDRQSAVLCGQKAARAAGEQLSREAGSGAEHAFQKQLRAIERSDRVSARQRAKSVSTPSSAAANGGLPSASRPTFAAPATAPLPMAWRARFTRTRA